jgi:hypothetical protein
MRTGKWRGIVLELKPLFFRINGKRTEIFMEALILNEYTRYIERIPCKVETVTSVYPLTWLFPMLRRLEEPSNYHEKRVLESAFRVKNYRRDENGVLVIVDHKIFAIASLPFIRGKKWKKEHKVKVLVDHKKKEIVYL